MKRLLAILTGLLLAVACLAQQPEDSLLLSLSKATNHQKADTYLQLAATIKGDTAKSNAYAKKAYQAGLKHKDVNLQAKALLALANIRFNANEFQKSIAYYEKAANIYKILKDTTNIIDCYRLIGMCFYKLDMGDSAITQFIEGLKLCENDQETTARFLVIIAMTHARMNNFREAAEYYRKSLALYSSLKDYEGMAINFNNLGEIYSSLHHPDSALISYMKVKRLSKNPELQAKALSNMGGIYLSYKDSLKKAIICLQQSRAIFKQLGIDKYDAEFYQGMGIVMLRQGKFRPAIEAFKKSIELNDKYNRGLKVKSTGNNLLSIAYEKIGDYQSSLKHLKLYIKYSNELVQNEKYDKLAELEKKYEKEHNENTIAKLEAQNKLDKVELEKNKQLKQLGLTAAILLLLLVFFIGLKYFDKMKSNRMLESKNRIIAKSEKELRLLNASKNKFFSIIAHDLKNPLHTVLGYSDLLNKEYDRFSEEERRTFASEIYRSTDNIFQLLQNLLEWARAQTGRMEFSPTVVEYQRILDNSLSALKSAAYHKGIEIKTNNDPNLQIYVDPFMIETVMRNLISNAIKFTPKDGNIEISAKKTDQHVLISVADSGIGMPEDETNSLFKIDSKVKRKGTNNEEGSGLGLILCKEFVDKNQGKIWVESLPKKGSSFFFTVPVTPGNN